MNMWQKHMSAALAATAKLYPYNLTPDPAFEVIKGVHLTANLKVKRTGFSCPEVVRWQLCLVDRGLNPAYIDDKFMIGVVALL